MVFPSSSFLEQTVLASVSINFTLLFFVRFDQDRHILEDSSCEINVRLLSDSMLEHHVSVKNMEQYFLFTWRKIRPCQTKNRAPPSIASQTDKPAATPSLTVMGQSANHRTPPRSPRGSAENGDTAKGRNSKGEERELEGRRGKKSNMRRRAQKIMPPRQRIGERRKGGGGAKIGRKKPG